MSGDCPLPTHTILHPSTPFLAHTTSPPSFIRSLTSALSLCKGPWSFGNNRKESFHCQGMENTFRWSRPGLRSPLKAHSSKACMLSKGCSSAWYQAADNKVWSVLCPIITLMSRHLPHRTHDAEQKSRHKIASHR